ncbi:ATP-binding protein [Psychromarinibacter sp. C21-152]|uniref:histidine kinase n=1 Tax=Psychromarinibacter sediminicola TaxID=3033385 RepID=A0AAE3NRG9_9RHOB|nr:PAS domain-containing hybrid sensor histidine kinase/response regulator [Psychromarinibacter sediminicola]MDF0600661.1 ATP-binding protein [Psychromarinibacter sediminicola]
MPEAPETPTRGRPAAGRVRGNWLLRLLAGDVLHERDALRRRLQDVRSELEAERAECRRSAALAAERAARLEQAMDLGQLGYIVWNAKTDACERCSPQMAAAFGMTPREFIARAHGMQGPHLLIHPDDRATFGAAFRRLRSGEPFDIVYRTNNAAGARLLRVVGRPIRDETGQVARFFCVATDVTDQQDETARKAELLRMESLGRLTGGIAHDFNNLLAVVLGNLELLDEAADPADRQAMIEEMIAATLRGRDLTRRMLGFARRAPQAPDRVDLAAVVRDMGPLLYRTLPETISLDLAPGPPTAPVVADRSLMDSALLNLAINARDAMPEGGRLTVSVRDLPAADPAADGSEAQVRLTVADTGAGIPPELRDKVFQPFFSTKDAVANSGLGLAMVQSFIRQAGGRIEVDSAPGRGTAFHLYFNTVPEDAAADPAPPAVRSEDIRPRRGTRVLVVEDEPAVRRILALQLERSGIDVTEAADAEEAVAAFDAGGPFDLLVSDVVVPGAMQGPALAAHLRDRQPDLKVIFQSGYPQAAGEIDGDGRGDIVLLKPVNRQELLHAVQTALEA